MVMKQVSLTRRTRKNNAISAYSSANGGVNNNRLFKNQMDDTNFHDLTNLSSISRNDALRNETSADSNNNNMQTSKPNLHPWPEPTCKPNLTTKLPPSNETQPLKSKKMAKNTCKQKYLTTNIYNNHNINIKSCKNNNT